VSGLTTTGYRRHLSSVHEALKHILLLSLKEKPKRVAIVEAVPGVRVRCVAEGAVSISPSSKERFPEEASPREWCFTIEVVRSFRPKKPRPIRKMGLEEEPSGRTTSSRALIYSGGRHPLPEA
jgi:hypothetical protein